MNVRALLDFPYIKKGHSSITVTKFARLTDPTWEGECLPEGSSMDCYWAFEAIHPSGLSGSLNGLTQPPLLFGMFATLRCVNMIKNSPIQTKSKIDVSTCCEYLFFSLYRLSIDKYVATY